MKINVNFNAQVLTKNNSTYDFTDEKGTRHTGTSYKVGIFTGETLGEIKVQKDLYNYLDISKEYNFVGSLVTDNGRFSIDNAQLIK